jgi:predicted MFS family arabinose efflux permease
VLAFVPETKPTEAQLEESMRSNSTEKAEKGGVFKALMTRPFLLLYVFITTWFGFVYAQHRFILPLQTDALFGADGAPLYGLLMTTNAVIVVFLNIPIVAMLKRFNPVVNTAISGFLYAIGFGMIAFLDKPWMFFVSTFVWTVGEIVNATNSQVYVANHTPMSHRARFNAVLPIIWGIGWTISTPVSGALAKSVGLSLTWIIVGAVAALAASGVLLLDRAETRYKAKTGIDTTEGCGEPEDETRAIAAEANVAGHVPEEALVPQAERAR